MLAILRKEIYGGAVGDCCAVSAAELRSVMRLAGEHTVQGLVADAAMRGGLDVAADDAAGRQQAVMGLMQVDMTHKKCYRRFETAIADFARLMNAHHLRYVVFKGVAVARLYQQPYARTMGDVDFYVHPDDFDCAVLTIERELHVVIDRDDIDKHYAFDFQDIRFEMHYQIETFGYGRHQRRFNRIVDEALAKNTDSFMVCDSDGNETEVSVLPPTEDLIVVFKHWFNHLLVEGVGLRQTFDLAVLLNAYRDKINVARLMTALDGIGYMKAFRAMLAMIKQYFGMEWLDSFFVFDRCDERYGNKLMAAVMESGNFGRKAYRNNTEGKKKSMETATRALCHCVTFLRLATKDIICLIPRRIGITLKQRMNETLHNVK